MNTNIVLDVFWDRDQDKPWLQQVAAYKENKSLCLAQGWYRGQLHAKQLFIALQFQRW